MDSRQVQCSADKLINICNGNFRNYNTYIIFLVIFAYVLPIGAMYVSSYSKPVR